MARRLALLLAFLGLAGCVSSGPYRPVAATLPGLEVAFAQAAWDGKHIPRSGICSNFGGDDISPPLIVGNIPAGANAIIVQFNDLDHPFLARRGGHGTIGFWIEGDEPAQLPSVTGYAVKLPEGAFIVHPARTSGAFASQGYLAPCSGGKGHHYVADVLAVYKATGAGEHNRVLAEQRFALGRY